MYNNEWEIKECIKKNHTEGMNDFFLSFLCVVYFVVSGLCDGLITSSKESCQVCVCVCVCVCVF